MYRRKQNGRWGRVKWDEVKENINFSRAFLLCNFFFFPSLIIFYFYYFIASVIVFRYTSHSFKQILQSFLMKFVIQYKNLNKS